MGVCVGDLTPRQIESFRAELVETLAAHLAYPPFFDYRSGQLFTRPVDRSKREEIEHYVRSTNFGPIDRNDITSTDVRRFLERLLYRYLEVNDVFQRPHVARRAPQRRSLVPRLAAEIQRHLAAYVQNNAQQLGERRSTATWSGGRRLDASSESHEHYTRVLQAVLARRDGGAPAPAKPTPTPPPASPRPVTRHAASWPTGSYDATVPAPAQGFSDSLGASPFLGLETGQQSSVFAGSVPVSDMSTGPLRSAISAGPASAAPAAARELPPDLYQLYGDYLRDMEPEAAAPPSSAFAPGVPDAPTAELPVPPVAAPRLPAQAEPLPETDGSIQAQSASNGNQSDKLIFFQLRYQLEAYVRRAARSYGVSNSSGDPSGVLDALRRSGFVDEADLRIAEGILALTDRVTQTGAASAEDYRQALMLYLLYHRSHLG